MSQPSLQQSPRRAMRTHPSSSAAALTILMLLVASTLLACAPAATPSSGGEPVVLAAETFLADIAQNVAGDRLVVQSLLAPGVDPHEYQSTPQDAIRLSRARLLLINGLGYESWLNRSLAAADHIQIVEAASGLNPGARGDPHVWMDPRNVVHFVANIRDALTALDPSGAAAYAANADAYSNELNSLDAWIRSQIEQIPADRRLLVTNHHALGAFADAYGLQVAGVVIPGLTTEAAPSAQQMAALIQTIQSTRTPAIFLDVSENPSLARQIAAETGAQVVTGLYVETLSAADGPAPTYIQMLRYDVGLIVEALK
ncbi:MAG TPA: zinc ABC transporter substrate-binding protein [Anaerolineales bacterium]|nr:zinc ABC transporter substrate-binding protein [Anaerolineales bacterium]